MTDGIVNPNTGEVSAVAETFGFVPLDLAAMNEDELLAMFPTPVQLSGALIVARAKNSQAPAAIARYREQLRTAERSLKVAEGLALVDLRKEHGRTVALTEMKNIALATNPRVIDAQDKVDNAWLELEFARDFERALRVDIDILRSLNANLRHEVRG